MRNKILSFALLSGAVIGIGGGAARLAHHHHHHRDRMMRHVARTCVQAARDLDRGEPPRRGPQHDAAASANRYAPAAYLPVAPAPYALPSYPPPGYAWAPAQWRMPAAPPPVAAATPTPTPLPRADVTSTNAPASAE